MHLGRIAAVPLVALDRPGEPPARLAGRGQQRLAELARRAPEGDPLEALAAVATGEPANMAAADDAGLEQPRRACGDPRPGPAGAIRPRRIERVAQRRRDPARSEQGIEQESAV